MVRRDYRGELLNYAFATEEVIEKTSGLAAGIDLHNALNLHETGRSETRSVTDSMIPPALTEGTVTTGRAVVLVGYEPVGVLPETSKLLDADGLVKLAKIGRPTEEGQRQSRGPPDDAHLR